MEVIAEQPWHFVLLKDGAALFLTYMTGGVVEAPITIRLAVEEAEAIQSGALQPKQLAEQFRGNRAKYQGREVTPAILPPAGAQQGAPRDGFAAREL